jgi:hypothetical protein
MHVCFDSYFDSLVATICGTAQPARRPGSSAGSCACSPNRRRPAVELKFGKLPVSVAACGRIDQAGYRSGAFDRRFSAQPSPAQRSLARVSQASAWGGSEVSLSRRGVKRAVQALVAPTGPGQELSAFQCTTNLSLTVWPDSTAISSGWSPTPSTRYFPAGTLNTRMPEASVVFSATTL